MDAIDSHYDTSEASALAIEAGANIILLAAEPTAVETIFPFLLSGSDSSALIKKAIGNSYSKIISTKENNIVLNTNFSDD
jgi:hypothetical protein